MTLTAEDIQRYIRGFLYTIAGAMVAKGWMADGYRELFVGMGLWAINLAWQIYGMRLMAKVAELGKIAEDHASPVAGVITTKTPAGLELAKAVPSPTVVPAGTVPAAQIAKA